MERRGPGRFSRGQEKACNNNNYCDIFIARTKRKNNSHNNNNENENEWDKESEKMKNKKRTRYTMPPTRWMRIPFLSLRHGCRPDASDPLYSDRNSFISNYCSSATVTS